MMLGAKYTTIFILIVNRSNIIRVGKGHKIEAEDTWGSCNDSAMSRTLQAIVEKELQIMPTRKF